VILASRKNGAPDPFLDWKVRLFFVGAIVALVGMGLDSSLIVGVAILVLLVGASLRFLPREKQGANGIEGAEGAEGDKADADVENVEISPPPVP
jgi:hypothetical protein